MLVSATSFLNTLGLMILCCCLSGAIYAQDGIDRTKVSDADLERMAQSHSAARGHIDDSSFSPEELTLIHHCEKMIMCACPKENYSKTLQGCPDGCANPQKNEIRRYVSQGLKYADIARIMEARYGPRVLAAGKGMIRFLVTPLIFIIGLIIVFVVIMSFKNKAKSAEANRSSNAELVSDEERNAVLAELKEIE